VRQLDDTHVRWRAEVAGKDKEWDAEITEQLPDQRIAWRSVSGARNAGVVTFHRIDDDTTRIMLQMDYEPEGVIENAGDTSGVLSLRIQGDLERFKDFVESSGQETGAWRGKVQQGQNQPGQGR
jgi:uncharacterized membrane protein